PRGPTPARFPRANATRKIPFALHPPPCESPPQECPAAPADRAPNLAHPGATVSADAPELRATRPSPVAPWRAFLSAREDPIRIVSATPRRKPGPNQDKTPAYIGATHRRASIPAGPVARKDTQSRRAPEQD